MGRWATEKEVLRYFRMRTPAEARRRQIFVSLYSSLLTGAAAWVIPTVGAAYVGVLLSGALYTLALEISPLKDPDILPQTDTQDRSDDIPGYMAKESAGPGQEKSYQRQKIERGILAVAGAFVIAAIPQLFPGGIAAALYALISFGCYWQLILSALHRIEEVELPEFPNGLWERSKLRFYANFRGARGYFFIGEVNGKMIGLPRMLRFMHTLIAGPTGEGKSSSHIIPPLLFDADSRGSAVVPDAKSPDLFNEVAGRWMAMGKRPFLFDPWHQDCVGIEPLNGANDDDLLTIVEVFMRERQEKLTDDPFFSARTKYLLFAIFKMVQRWEKPFANLASAFYVVQSVEKLKDIVNSETDDIQELFSDFMKMQGETQVNATNSIKEKLQIFMDPAVRAAFSASEFELSDLFAEGQPCLLILGAPMDKKDQGTKIASLLVNLISNMAFRERRLYKQAKAAGKKAFVPSDLYLYADELRNLRITAFPDLISIARETRTHVIGSVTDLGFFRYYREDADGIMGNLRTRIFLQGMDLTSCEYLSTSLGQENTITYRLLQRGVMASQEKAKLLDADEVMHLGEKNLLIFTPCTWPFIAQRVSIFESKYLQSLKVPAPQNHRENYVKWGVAAPTGLGDNAFPVLRDGAIDYMALRGNKRPEAVKTNVTPYTFAETGGGKFRQSHATSAFNVDSEAPLTRVSSMSEGDIAGALM